MTVACPADAVKHSCPVCEKLFVLQRPGQELCSSKCRQRRSRARRLAVGLRLAQVTAQRDKAIAREQLLHRTGLDGGVQ